MDPAACRVIYIDDRFNTERWISREGAAPVLPQHRAPSQTDFAQLPPDLQANVNAFLSVFNQVYVCRSGRSFSQKLSELHEQVRQDCTPILACFDVGSEIKHDHFNRARPRFAPGSNSAVPGPMLRREITFSAESDESYGFQLLSRIASDLQVEESAPLIIPVAVVQPKRQESCDEHMREVEESSIARAPYGSETMPAKVEDHSDILDPALMLQCLDAGATDVVRSPLDKAATMGLTVHAYRIYKHAKNEQKGFMAQTRKRRKASWVGVDTDEKPYAYLREAMVKKLLKGICDPQNVIEDYQHRDLYVSYERQQIIAEEVGSWGFCGHDFTEDELVFAGYTILNHALALPELENWRMSRHKLLRLMQGCQVAYNSFVLYHNFRHAVDVLQSLFYFLVQIGALPPYPTGSSPPPRSQDKSLVAKLLGPFEALTLLISAIGHDVGHPGVNNMFLVKLNAPLAQLYNDQSVLEAFHCAAYSQILRRHWPVVFHDKAMRKLMISSILATDMGVHSDYMSQLGRLQEKVDENNDIDTWSPKDIDTYRNLICGLLIKCADISNVARPWSVAEKWTHLLQKEFAHQGEMEAAVGLETTLFGGPPELGNMLKLANGQIGFMTIFAHPLFANVADVVPAMTFAADEILTNKGVWFTRAEQEKHRKQSRMASLVGPGTISPRSTSPAASSKRHENKETYFSSSPLRSCKDASGSSDDTMKVKNRASSPHDSSASNSSSLAAVAGLVSPDLKGRAQTSRSGPGTTNTKTPETSGSVTAAELHDERRDVSESMRAGTVAVPQNHVGTGVDVETLDHTQHELSKFKFATSEEDEPVRTWLPEKVYTPDHPELRASAPTHNLDHQKQQAEMAVESRQTTSSDANTAPTSLQETSHGEPLTPSHSTNATSVTSTEQSDAASPTPQGADSRRNRSVSAPSRSPLLRELPGETASYQGSKADVRTTILSNGGDITDEGGQPLHKSTSKTLGRKRSKMRFKDLAFWKKRDTSDENAQHTEAS